MSTRDAEEVPRDERGAHVLCDVGSLDTLLN